MKNQTACLIAFPDNSFFFNTETNSCEWITIYQINAAADSPNLNYYQASSSTSLLINNQDTIKTSTNLLGIGVKNINYHLIYAEYTNKGGTPIWKDGGVDLQANTNNPLSNAGGADNGLFQYTPTIPQPHAGFYNPNAYAYLYSFVLSDVIIKI